MSAPMSGYVMTHCMCIYVICHSLWISVGAFGYIVTDCRCIFPSLDPCFSLSLNTSMSVRLYCHWLYVNRYVYWSAFLSLSVCLSVRYIVGNYTCIRTSLDSYFFLSLCLWICVAVSGYFITHWCGDLNNRTANEVPTSQSDNVFARAAEKQQQQQQQQQQNQPDTQMTLYWIHLGKLLNMCTTFGLNILNGVCNGDLQGRYTFMYNSGNKVSHYFVVFRVSFFSYSTWLLPSCYGKNGVRPFATGIVYKR